MMVGLKTILGENFKFYTEVSLQMGIPETVYGGSWKESQHKAFF